MNKIYKLVYSKTLNSLIAVSELAKSAQAGSSSSVEVEFDKGPNLNLNKLALSFVVSSLFTALPLSVSATQRVETQVQPAAVATATADSNVKLDEKLNFVSEKGFSATNAGVVAEANGPAVKYINNVPVVDIVNANAAGVSDNRFTKFNTDTGVVFNNKAGNVEVTSKLLGKIQGNAQLTKEAEVILAQITGNDKSVIKGTMEVLGKKADLLVINPNGIDLNGVQLVNTKEFTATTAERVTAENYKNLTVNQGEVVVSGSLTSDDVDMIRLIAAAVKVKAQISPHTKDGKKADIVVAGGKQSFDLNTNTGKATSETKANTEVVISGDALGLMYGKNVNFIVSETGAGVDFGGTLIADENLKITADGKLSVQNTFSKGDTTLESKSSEVVVKEASKATDKVAALGKIDLKAKVKVDAVGTLHSNKAIEVSSYDVSVGNVTADDVQLKAQRLLTTKDNTKVVANNALIKTDAYALLDGRLVVNKDLKVDGKSDAVKAAEAAGTGAVDRYNSILKFNDEVTVLGKATIHAATVEFNTSKVEATRVAAAKANNEALFKFNNLELEVRPNPKKAGLELKGGDLVANNLALNISNDSFDLARAPLVKVADGKFTVHQTASLDLRKANKVVTLNDSTEYQYLSNAIKSLNGTFTEVKTTGIQNSGDVKLDRAVRFTVDTFDNSGIIDAANSISITGKNITNTGVLSVKGQLVLNASEKVRLDGATYVYNSMNVTSPVVEQSGRVSVGGNFEVVTDNYHQSTKYSGTPTVQAGELSGSANLHYHSLRKDKYWFVTSFGAVSTDNMQFQTAETTVLGNMKVEKLTKDQAETLANDKDTPLFKVEDGRIAVGGDLTVDGSMEVSTTGFKVKAQEIFKYKQPFTFKFVPISLLNTYLTEENHIEYNNLYEFFESIDTRGEWQRGWAGYGIDTTQILNTFKQAKIDPSLNKVISQVFGADWRGLSRDQFVNKWNEFKANPDKFQTVIFAPNSEVLTLGNFTQQNGHLYVGTAEGSSISDKVSKGVANNKFHILVEASENVDITKKINGVRTFESYANLFDKEIVKNADGTYKLAKEFGWTSYGDVAASIAKSGVDKNKLVADSKALSVVVIEQYKDLVGGYLSVGKDAASLIAKLAEGSKAYEAAKASYKLDDQYRATMMIDGKLVTMQDAKDLFEYVENHYDRIDWKQGANGKWEPVVKVSRETLAKTTNFDQVAASLSGVQSLKTVNNSGVEVVYGSLNSKHVALDSSGSIKVISTADQNSINSDRTEIRTDDDFTSIGNLRVGNLELEAADVNLQSLAYFTENGHLNHTGTIATDDATIKAENKVVLEAADIRATGDVKIEATDVEMKSAYNEASSFVSDTISAEDSGRQITQSGHFVDSATISAKNIEVKADDVALESAKIVASEKAVIETDNLTNTARADITDTKLMENRISFTASARAEFGSYKAEAAYQFIDSVDLDGNKNKNYSTSVTDAAAVATGAPVAAGFQFTVETTRSETVKSEHVNNQLSAQELVVKVKEHAELGNTNINTDGKATSALSDVTSGKTAVIEAGSISQTNAKNTLEVESEKHTTTVGLELSADSSAVALVSHATSASRAGDMGKKVDGTFALTAVGDTLGLATADLAGGNAKLSVTDTRAKTHIESISDSTNSLGGSVSIKTTGETQLKAISGTLNNLEITAQKVTIEGGVTETKNKFDNISHTTSIDANSGVGLTGASTSASLTQSFSMTQGASDSVVHNASKLTAENITIHAEEEVTLKSTQLNALDTVDVAAKEVNVISEQDTFKSSSHGGGGSLTVGASIGTAPMAFGSVGGFVEKHHSESVKTNTVSAITGNKVKVEAETLTLQSGVLAAKTEGEVNVEKVVVTNNVDKETNDGGRIGVQIGTNKTGAAILNVNGGRDAHSEYEGVIQSTIGSNIKVAEKAQVVDDKDNAVELNRDLDKVVEVVKDDKYQETTFSITATSNMVKDIKNAVEQIVGAAQSGAAKVADTVSDMVETIAEKTTSNIAEGVTTMDSVAAGGDNNGYGTKGGSKSTAYAAMGDYPAYRTHYVTAPDSPGYRDANYNAGGVYNPYGPSSYNSGSVGYRSADVLYSSHANSLGSSYANPYSSSSYGTTYSSGGTYNSSTGSWSNLGNNYDVGSSSLALHSTSNLASSSFGDSTPGYNSSRLQFDSSENASSNLNRAYATDSTIELDKDTTIQDVRFGDVLANTRGDGSNAVVGGHYNLIGEDLGAVTGANVASHIDFAGLGGSLTVPETTPTAPTVSVPETSVPNTNTGSTTVNVPSTSGSTSGIDVSKEVAGVPGTSTNVNWAGSNTFGNGSTAGTGSIGSIGGSSSAGNGFSGGSFGGGSSSSSGLSTSTGSGTGTGTSSTTGGLSGSSSTSTSGSATGSNTGIASNTGTGGTGVNNGSAGSATTFPANNGATGGFDLDFGSSSTTAGSSSENITVSSGSSSITGSGSTSGSISGNSGNVNTNANSNSQGATVTDSSSANNSVSISTSPSNSNSSSSTETASSNGGLTGVLAGGEDTTSSSSSTSSSTGSVSIGGSTSSSASSSSEGGEITASGSSSSVANSGSGSASVTIGNNSSSASSEEAKVSNITTGTTPNEYTINNTPADGFASVGQKIDVGSKSTVTKYTVGNLACYVMSTHGNQQTNKIENSDEFKKALKNAAKPRQTIFSTYSNGIESLIGDGGVICMPQGSTEINTDYNIVKSTTDIPIIKSAKDAEDVKTSGKGEDYKPLEAIVVNEKQQVQVVRVVSNKSVQTKKVVRQQARVNVAEVAKIKSTLQGQGIDAKQIMILGVKGGSNNSIIEKVQKGSK